MGIRSRAFVSRSWCKEGYAVAGWVRFELAVFWGVEIVCGGVGCSGLGRVTCEIGGEVVEAKETRLIGSLMEVRYGTRCAVYSQAISS